MKQTIILLAMIFSLASCSSDESETPSSTEPDRRIAPWVNSIYFRIPPTGGIDTLLFDSDAMITRYTYDGKNIHEDLNIKNASEAKFSVPTVDNGILEKIDFEWGKIRRIGTIGDKIAYEISCPPFNNEEVYWLTLQITGEISEYVDIRFNGRETILAK